MRARVARSRELVARGYALAAVARVLQVTRQAIYRVPKPRSAPQRRPPVDPVDVAIVEVAQENPTDGYRMVWALVRRKLGRAVNRKRVLRVMREQKLSQRRGRPPRRRRPGVFRVTRPAQLWHMDMTAVWVAEHGWVYLNAIHRLLHPRDRRVGRRGPLSSRRGDRRRRTRRRRAGDRARDAHARDRQRLGVHGPQVSRRAVRARDHAPSWRLPRPREPGVHRELVLQAQGAPDLADGVRDARPAARRARRLRRPLPPPPHSGLDYRTPKEVRQTWDDAQEQLQKLAA